MKKLHLLLATSLLLLLSSCIVVTAGKVDSEGQDAEQIRVEKFQSIADPKLSDEERAQAIVDKMTLDQKLRFISGYQSFFTIPIKELGIRSLKLVDASMGIRANGRSTAFPGAICYASSFNKDLAYEVGQVIAEECRAKGVDILLGPGVNIQRIPTNGRSWEYLGEDPFLAGEVASQFIKGIQDKGVIACVKHFAANNSDFDRHCMDSVVDTRTLHEIYFPAFEKAVKKGGVTSVMTSYNPVNGISASENKYLITDTLRNRWGYKYFVMSDWISVYNTYEPFVAGLDLEMPSGQWMNPAAIKRMVRNGQLTQEEMETELNNKVFRIMMAAIKIGVFDRPQVDPDALEFGGFHDEVANKVAAEGIVLLKNENNVLPIDRTKVKKIVVVGSNALSTPTSAGGAGWVIAHKPMSFFKSIKAAAGEGIDVRHVSSSNIVAIKNADVAIVCEGWNTISEEESLDRYWKMMPHQINNIKNVAKYNPNTVVVVNTGGAFETASWIDDVAALVHPFFLGQSGVVLGQVLFGDVNPSGKLPFTFAKDFADYESTKNYLPKGRSLMLLPRLPEFGSKVLRQIWPCNYEEGLKIGYRQFMTDKIDPQFAFGYGLSYTDFAITNAKLSSSSISKNGKVTVSCKVTNNGSVKGAEVVQVYVHDDVASVFRPEMELKGFDKVFLEPGESKTISIELDGEAFRYFDEKLDDWTIESGAFEVRVGNSSDNIIAKLPLQVR